MCTYSVLWIDCRDILQITTNQTHHGQIGDHLFFITFQIIWPQIWWCNKKSITGLWSNVFWFQVHLWAMLCLDTQRGLQEKVNRCLWPTTGMELKFIQCKVLMFTFLHFRSWSYENLLSTILLTPRQPKQETEQYMGDFMCLVG